MASSGGLNTKQSAIRQPKKRIIVCCDGTWNNGIASENPLTNVSRIARSVNEVADDGTGMLQVVYYHSGVGSGTSWFANGYDGATGRGISANVRNAYSFICHNYNFDAADNERDEIILIGFSRGAYTVRCVAALIDHIGVLCKRGLIYLPGLYSMWKAQTATRFKDRVWLYGFTMEDEIICRESGPFLKQRCEDLEKLNLLKTGVKIKACAVWDTVKALGSFARITGHQSAGIIPMSTVQKKSSNYSSVTNHVSGAVENAFHAVALQERRRKFKPQLWHSPASSTTLKQCWFLGAHSDVGGGNKDVGLANLSLIWMVAQLQKYANVSFDIPALLDFMTPQKLEWEEQWVERIREFKFGVPAIDSLNIGIRLHSETYVRTTSLTQREITGKPKNSLRGIYRVLGKRTRIPGRYVDRVPCTLDENNSREDMTVNACQERKTPDTVHFTVRAILNKRNDKCKALKGYKTSIQDSRVVWNQEDSGQIQQSENSPTLNDQSGESSHNNAPSLSEADVLDEELDLLKKWLDYNGGLTRLPPQSDSETRKHRHWDFIIPFRSKSKNNQCQKADANGATTENQPGGEVATANGQDGRIAEPHVTRELIDTNAAGPDSQKAQATDGGGGNDSAGPDSAGVSPKESNGAPEKIMSTEKASPDNDALRDLLRPLLSEPKQPSLNVEMNGRGKCNVLRLK